ncbi:MAG: ABC transporter permease, partial [Anaerolineae bacterium]|nr:ABC transporter permease [Anaerolineae bacterium]
MVAPGLRQRARVAARPREASRRTAGATGARRRFGPGANLVVGGGMVALLVAMALLAPVLAPAPPMEIRPGLRLLPPSPGHPFGTDPFGRDLFSRVLFGARLALGVSAGATALAAAPGVALGLLAGYRGNGWDQVLSRLVDAWLSFPGLLLAVVLVARLGPSLTSTMWALGILGVPAFYRLARAGALSARHAAYVEAARAIGASEGRILLRHVLPELASPLVVLCTLRLGTVLLAVGGLSFIGLGAQPPQPEWGALLAAGRDYMHSAWWLAFFPGAAIAWSVMGFNLL